MEKMNLFIQLRQEKYYGILNCANNEYEYNNRINLNENVKDGKIYINLHNGTLKNRCIKEVIVRISSNEISNETLDDLLKDAHYKIKMENSKIYSNKFVNNTNLVPKYIFIMNNIMEQPKTKKYESKCIITRISRLLEHIDEINVDVSVTYLDFSNEINNRMKEVGHEFIVMKNNKINILRIMSGLPGLVCNEYSTPPESAIMNYI